MPRHCQRPRWVLRAEAGRSSQPISSSKGRSTQDQPEREQWLDGVRNQFLQDQLLSQRKEAIQTKMVQKL
jgi:hypothetical protein